VLNGNGRLDDLHDARLGKLVYQLGVHQASKIAMQTLITADKLVQKAKAWKKTAILEPKDGTKARAKKDPLDGGKSDAALCKRCISFVTPLQSPISFSTNARYGLDCVKKVGFYVSVPNEEVNQKAISLAVNAFHRDLKPIKATSLGALNLCQEVLEIIKKKGKKGKQSKTTERMQVKNETG
jgi:hypothetical protein